MHQMCAKGCQQQKWVKTTTNKTIEGRSSFKNGALKLCVAVKKLLLCDWLLLATGGFLVAPQQFSHLPMFVEECRLLRIIGWVPGFLFLFGHLQSDQRQDAVHFRLLPLLFGPQHFKLGRDHQVLENA